MDVASNNTTQSSFSRAPVNLQLTEPQAVRILRILLEISIGLFGIGGNILVCVAIKTRKRLKSVGNLFLFNLAIADLGVLVICLPLVILHSDFPFSWPFGEIVCKVLFPFTDIFYGVSIGSIVAISFHRYRMIVHCMETQFTATRAKMVIAIIWVVSYILFVLPLNLVMGLQRRGAKTFCNPSWPKAVHRQLYVTFVSILFYIMPLVIILGTYLRIRRKLSADSFLTSQMRDKQQSSTIKARLDQNKKALRLLTPVVIAFAILMFPINAIRLFASFHPNFGSTFPYRRLLYNLSVLLLLANSSINCIIYAVVNKDFRREFERILCCRCLKRLWEALPSPRRRLPSEGNLRLHTAYSTNDPKTIEELISHHDLEKRQAGNGDGVDYLEQKERLLRKLKRCEVKSVLEDESYFDSVLYCAYDDKLTIVVK